jgi:hypothetical protein
MTKGKRRPVQWNGIQYKSLADAARATGLNYQQLQKRIKCGHTCDDDVTPHKVECEWNGVTYHSIASAARNTGIPDITLRNYLDAGFTSNDDVAARKANNRHYDYDKIVSLLQANETKKPKDQLSGRKIAAQVGVSPSLVSRIKTALQEKQADG